jgi:hypothetical protein
MAGCFVEKERRKLTAAPLPSKQEQPLDSAVEVSVQLVAKGGIVVVALLNNSGAGVGSGSLLLRAGKVALRAGTVVTVVTVDVLNA